MHELGVWIVQYENNKIKKMARRVKGVLEAKEDQKNFFVRGAFCFGAGVGTAAFAHAAISPHFYFFFGMSMLSLISKHIDNSGQIAFDGISKGTTTTL